ncbi:MAG: hypothetical protein HQL76_15895 [Magnetococcales bacterium]|nr:hypothetical protein [Magnetococcales bacterium]
MSLKRALANDYAFFFLPSLPSDSRMARARERIDALPMAGTVVRVPPRQDLEQIRHRVATHFQDRGSLAGLSRRDLRRVPWLLFGPEPGGLGPLGNDEALKTAWSEWFAKNASNGIMVDLIHNLLLHYPEESERAYWKRLLHHPMSQAGPTGLAPWTDRLDRFDLLGSDGPERLAERLCRGEENCHELFQQAGLTGALASGGFVRETLNGVLKRLRGITEPNGMGKDRLKGVFDGLRDANGQWQQLVSGFFARMAEALLQPFLECAPETGLRNLIRHFLLGSLGDPRANPAAWQAVDPGLREVFLGWLTNPPFHHDEKIDFFVREANVKLAAIEEDLSRMQHRLTDIPVAVVNHAIAQLRAIAGVAEFFGLTEVMTICAEMTLALEKLRDQPTPTSGEMKLVATSFGRLQEAINNIYYY